MVQAESSQVQNDVIIAILIIYSLFLQQCTIINIKSKQPDIAINNNRFLSLSIQYNLI